MAITGLGRRGVFDYVLTMFEGKKADHRLLRRSGAVARNGVNVNVNGVAGAQWAWSVVMCLKGCTECCGDQ